MIQINNGLNATEFLWCIFMQHNPLVYAIKQYMTTASNKWQKPLTQMLLQLSIISGIGAAICAADVVMWCNNRIW
jgi:hypothetical protein